MHCGYPVPNHPGDPTVDPLAGVATRAGAAAPTPPAVRFTSGAIVGSRYRLVALLGKGGMGEVYRAEDLPLDQPVALKFLPEGVAANDSRLAQFHNELRVARQVSHKNVCRLYDVGEADGHRFLTMEYIDGQDLWFAPAAHRAIAAGQGGADRVAVVRGCRGSA